MLLTNSIMIVKIISGGQTGADQGGLDFALENGIEAGGWCPKGRICENGLIPARYPVEEVTEDDYNLRTKLNVAGNRESNINVIQEETAALLKKGLTKLNEQSGMES
jgi:hypothetical protein